MRRSRHVLLGFVALGGVVVVGTIGYVVLGFGVLDAVYQTVTTITTVGFREVERLDGAGQVFTIVLILAGVGTALYTLTVLLEVLVEGHLGEAMERRRMERQIAALHGHVIVCGWGRVGRAAARELDGAGRAVVVIDADPERVASVPRPYLQRRWRRLRRRRAAVRRHRTRRGARRRRVDRRRQPLHHVVGTLAATDVVHRRQGPRGVERRQALRAGADRVVNPQEIGGARIAAFVARPKVTEFLDVVMHAGETELVLEEVGLAAGSQLLGSSLAEAKVRDRTGALVLALHDPELGLVSVPAADMVMRPGQALIAIGTPAQLERLAAVAGSVHPPGARRSAASTFWAACGPDSGLGAPSCPKGTQAAQIGSGHSGGHGWANVVWRPALPSSSCVVNVIVNARYDNASSSTGVPSSASLCSTFVIWTSPSS